MTRGWSDRMKRVGIILAVVFMTPALILFVYSLIPSRRINQKDLIRDFDYTVDIVGNAYIDTKKLEDFTKRAEVLRRQIKPKMFRFEFYELMARLLSGLDDYSVTLSFGMPFYMPVMPFKVFPIDGKLYVTESVDEKLRACSEVLGVNGIKASDILKRLRSYVSAENDTLKDLRVADLFWKLPTLDRLENLSVETDEGVLKVETITRREYERLAEYRRPFEYFELNGIGVLRIRSFSIYRRDLIEWHDLLKDFPNTDTLIIDLRSNTGGSLSRAIELLETILNGEFKLRRKLKIRANYYSRETLEKMGIEWREGEIVERDSDIVVSGKGSFRGNVWILVDEYTSNSALDFALISRASGRAKIIGSKPLQPLDRNVVLTPHALPSAGFGLGVPDAKLIHGIRLTVDVILPESTSERLKRLCKGVDGHLRRVIETIKGGDSD